MSRFFEGQDIEILDANDVFCPGRIIKIHPDGSLQVRYVGWSEAWDENVTNFNRIVPADTYVNRYKSWTKLSTKFTHWPCIIYIRTPKIGSKKGIKYLKDEKRVFVVPCGPKKSSPVKPYAHGVWMKTDSIRPFQADSEKYIQLGIASRFSDAFEQALKEIQNCDARDVLFAFEGSYETSQPPGPVYIDDVSQPQSSQQECKRVNTGQATNDISIKRSQSQANEYRFYKVMQNRNIYLSTSFIFLGPDGKQHRGTVDPPPERPSYSFNILTYPEPPEKKKRKEKGEQVEFEIIDLTDSLSESDHLERLH